MATVSLIVPVYNAEKAITRCVDSILNQEFRDIELILIDDGSKDGSPAILDAIAKADERVVVIHKENAGVSATRNLGIERATGTYIQFLDADDWITPDSTKMLVRTAEETAADLVVAEFYRVIGGSLSRKGSIETDRVLTRQEYAQFMKESPADYYYGVIWNKLYRKAILDEYQIRMDQNVSFCEDFIFNLEYVLHCTRIAPLRLPVYYYVKTEGSLVSQNMSLRRVVDMKTSVYQYYDAFFRNVLNEKEYRAARPEIAAFLVSVATDNGIIPFAPKTKKVGKETVSVYERNTDSLSGDIYYMNKLYESFLHTAALKNGLNLNDVKVFAAVKMIGTADSLREIANLSGLGETQTLASLQLLARKQMVHITFSPLSASVTTDHGAGLIHDLDYADRDFEEACFEGLSEEERTQVSAILDKITSRIFTRMENSYEEDKH